MILFSNMYYAGEIPKFLSENDPRDAVKQIHSSYQHGGGWNDTVSKYKLDYTDDLSRCTITFDTGDPPFRLLSHGWLREEHLLLFEHAYLAVVQPDGSSRCARID